MFYNPHSMYATDEQDVEKSVRAAEAGRCGQASDPKDTNESKNENKNPHSSSIVDFDGPEDQAKAMNWSRGKKARTTVCFGLLTACSSWSTSIYATIVPSIAAQYGVSEVVATLGTTLFLVGLGLGTFFWAPVSELYGRKLAVLPPFFVAAAFAFGAATAENLQTIMLTRFFGGFFASAPLVNTGGVIADLYSAKDRSPAMGVYQICVNGGPLLAPLIGNTIVETGTDIRWTLYITGILILTALSVVALFVDETHDGTILTAKARRLRHDLHDWSLHAQHEETEASLGKTAEKYLVRPVQLLFTPICAAMCIYSAFVYALIYMTFTAFPIEYEEVRGWRPIISSLPFLAVLIGCVVGILINFVCNPFYLKQFAKNGDRPVPEARLLPMMVGSLLLVGGLLIWAWTAEPGIPWIGGVIGLVLLGAAFITIFQGAMNYLVDTFQANAASAIAVNAVTRSLLAGCFPLFTSAMFHNLGVSWAASVLALIALVLLPIPFFFYRYGYRIRASGRYSVQSTR